jgi:hypothetical protein
MGCIGWERSLNLFNKVLKKWREMAGERRHWRWAGGRVCGGGECSDEGGVGGSRVCVKLGLVLYVHARAGEGEGVCA